MPAIPQLLTLAVQHHQAGRLRAAEQVYRQILADEPNHADACHLLGVVAYQLGDSEAAIEHLGRAVRLQATNAAYHNSLGAAMRARGRLAEALASFRRAVELKPDYFDAHNNLGNALKAQGRLKDAAASYRRALALEPDRLDVHNKLGNTLQALGELDDALASYRRALELKPDYAEAYGNLGNTLQALGKSDEALASYRRALELKPDYAEAYNNLGNTLQALGKSEEALASYRRALELKPDYAGAYNNLGNALQAAGKLDEAWACLRRALELQPSHADAHNNLGNVLRAQGKLEDAVASYRRALELQPDHAETHSNLGNALKAQGELHAAQACYRRALESRPGYAEAHHNQALLWLLHGDFERGWPEYEWRWRQKGASPRPCRWPRWGGEPLAGKTILLYTEQGLGDTIQFIRFAPLVQSRGARVVFECPGALHRLLTGFRGIDELVVAGSPLPDVDVQAPLLSLPGILGTTLATIPADVPYLQAAPELVDRWRSELNSLAGLKIGVCWQGSPQYKADRDRSFPLTCLEPVGHCPGVQLISLQKGAGSEQLRAVEGRWLIHDWGSRLDESTGPFMDTAAVMMSLDLVISADTAVAHLAGALGVPVWLALTRIPHWPWMLDRVDSPWYPTMRLFRQRQLGDWADVFERLATALRERVALAGPRPALAGGLDVRSGEADFSRITGLSSVSEALTLALQHHQAGRLRAAEQVYRQILADEPNHADACHLLGVVAYQLGDPQAAVEHIGRAIRLQSARAAYHNSLGAARRAQGRLEDAVASYRRAVELQPDYFDAHNNLGNALKALGRFDDAAICYGRALALQPDRAATHNSLGKALQALGKLDEALACYRRALEWKPNFADAHNNLGNALQSLGNSDEAVASYRRALELKPDDAQTHGNLGNALQAQGKTTEALAHYRRALELKPDYFDVHNNLGAALKSQGMLADAVSHYRRALALKPDYAEVHNNLGNALQALGKPDEALVSYRRALELKPNYAEAYSNQGHALRTLGMWDEALASYRRALELKPIQAELHHSLGNALQARGEYDEALACYRRALELNPRYVEAQTNLGTVLQTQGQFDAARACYCRALELDPDYVKAHTNLGTVLQAQGQFDAARACYCRALELDPDSVKAHTNLGTVLQTQGQLDAARACYRRALDLMPDGLEADSDAGAAWHVHDASEATADHYVASELRSQFAEAFNNLASLLQSQGVLDEAEACSRRALKLSPRFAEAYINLGNALKDQCRVDAAADCYRQALDLKPDFVAAHSNLLMAIQYKHGTGLADLAAAHAQYGSRYVESAPAVPRQFGNAPDSNRRLRVGFISSDLGCHPVGYFVIRALEHVAQDEWEAACYSDRKKKDGLTDRFRAIARVWRDVAGWDVSRLAEQVLEDRIDVLFDLAGHTANNRLLVFARKPAPIQVTWAGYVGTTGLKTIDYILADRHEIPPEAEVHYCERVLRMPDGYVCYDPPEYAPPVSPLPALHAGQVTFGSFNNPAKINATVIDRWSQILHRVPQSRLVLKYRGVGNRSLRERLEEAFANQGIESRRLELLDSSPHPALLAEYHRIDIALDPFPYSGGLTTCEALWMGVPVVTCPGETFASRHSLSHLSNVGLTETIAGTLDEYVEIAVALSNDLPRLVDLRTRLRDQMAASPLCDGKRFAANLQAVVRGIWQAWCREQPAAQTT